MHQSALMFVFLFCVHYLLLLCSSEYIQYYLSTDLQIFLLIIIAVTF